MDGIYHVRKLTKELQAAGLPVAGVASTGRVDYSRELTKAEAAIAATVIAAHDAGLTDEEIERGLMAKAGITAAGAFLSALWAQAARGDSSTVNTLAEKMDIAIGGL